MRAYVFLVLLAAPGVLAAHAEFQIEVVAENLSVPWEVAFAPDGRIFVTERTGSLRVIQDGVLIKEPAITLAVSGTEGGLLGMALDPDYIENGHVYIYYSYSDGADIFNRVARYAESGNRLYNETILLDHIPGSRWHDGGRIGFGPDGMLYATTGDASNYNLSQDLDSLAGKILRIRPDGGIPEDNPFGSAVFSYGHRNPQGMDWHPDGALVISEHGPSGERGAAHDEINVIVPGGNYGWPVTVGDETAPNMTAPILHSGSETWAPAGAVFYDSEKIPEWYGRFFVSTLRGAHLMMLDLDLEGGTVLQSTKLLEGTHGRLRGAAMGPDGHLYVTTSNQDGRGSPTPNDDRILRIVPAADVPSPLAQTRAGTMAQDILCKGGLELVIKNDGTPACVRESSVKRLAETGWLQQDI